MSYEFRNISVLVVESNHAMFGLTKSVLTSFGVGQIYSAYGFEEGFRAFCRVNPDMIISDWLEEPHNGLELTKKIRTDKQSPNPFVPIILMTGYSMKKRVMMARDSGITEFLVKPFTAKALYQRIEQMIERPRQFVKGGTYFGPDRRRQRTGEYVGPERRVPIERPAKSKAQHKKATEIARDIKKRLEEKKGK